MRIIRRVLPMVLSISILASVAYILYRFVPYTDAATFSGNGKKLVQPRGNSAGV